MACEEPSFPTGMEGKVVTVEFVNNDCKKFQYEDGDLVSDLYFPNDVHGFIQNIGENVVYSDDENIEDQGRQFMQNLAYSCKRLEFPNYKQGVVRFANAKDPRYRDRFDHDRFNPDREISDFFMFWPGFMGRFQSWVTLHPEEMMEIVRANVARLITDRVNHVCLNASNACINIVVDGAIWEIVDTAIDEQRKEANAVEQRKRDRADMIEQNDIDEADRFAKKAKAVADKASEFAGVTERICKKAGLLMDEAVIILHDVANISTVHTKSLSTSAQGVAIVLTQFWNDMEGIVDEAKRNAAEAKSNADKAYDDHEDRILLSAD